MQRPRLSRGGSRVDRAAVLRAVRDHEDRRGRNDAVARSLPAAEACGKQDGIAPAVYAQEFGDRIKGSRVELIDGAGHLPHLEQMAQVTKVIGEFLGS